MQLFSDCMIISGRSSANGSSPTSSRAHQTAWPRPSGTCWRVKLGLPRRRLQPLQAGELVVLAALGERVIEFELHVEMVLDDRLVASGHEDEMLDAGLACLVDDILDDRLVDDGQHFLGDGLGGREETRAEAGDRENCLANSFHAVNYPF